jgi:hypothetical protein
MLKTWLNYPVTCAACNQDLTESDSQRDMGYYVLELEPELFGFRIVTSLHHYYHKTCSCGHWLSLLKPQSFILGQA